MFIINILNKLMVISQCKELNNNIQAQFIYKLLKIFFKSFQGDITPLFLIDENYEKWSNIIINVIKTPISNENVKNTKNVFWKLRRICFQIITRIYQKFSIIITKNYPLKRVWYEIFCLVESYWTDNMKNSTVREKLEQREYNYLSEFATKSASNRLMD